ncbi:hypothetical protein PSEUBRA_004610 [Kalmanozyma brasiliensis GHG001]|uniref:uncharacterized protein n=1 Tax=Kalmanozyma brasiliensis (strain GHG001) TaxID=1365824 RepID=UPI0028680102|nr:uncharacterized protein PSEUBRA_004610 [Kalmanozyma brasiliensis GHG001]KAF6767393.1 hypothetical protein PSEUBRA_004610 [Kalmanozyma brasiliensis GHG001]
MGSKEDRRAQEDASVAAPRNAGLPSRPEGEPLSVSDLAAMSHLSAMSSLSPMMGSMNQRGSGRGRGGRGGYRNNFRGTGIQTQGGLHSTGSSYGYSQPRQHYGGKPATQDARQDDRQLYASQQQQMGRGGARGGFCFGQQPSGRKPRGGGRSRGTSLSRPRDHPARPSLDQPAQGLFSRVATIDADAAAAEAHSVWDTQVETAATMPQQHVEDAPAQTPVPHNVVLPSVEDHTNIEASIDAAVDAVEQRRESETSESEASLSLVKVDRTPSLDSNTTEDTDATIQSIPEPFDELVTPTTTSTATPSTPTHPIHLQDIHFASVPNPVHPAPGQPPETICAWYTYPMPPREGVFMAPLPRLSPVNSGPPPPPPPHHPMAPPSHFYFTHDHAYLALCHPVPMLPYAWLPIPYLAYWGPERLGNHPNYYDVPAVSAKIPEAA